MPLFRGLLLEELFARDGELGPLVEDLAGLSSSTSSVTILHPLL